ncbi:MAG TPA: HAMP domain-containing sensor histidine kinase, partial [Pseudomonas sp.]|nr:HAMP domain-containing sensor histidine kinase [Pseudomonas sp.]
HELRSPLTALSLQADRLAVTQMSPQAQERLVPLQRGIERGRRLIDQLLSLARAQSSHTAPKQRVSVFATYRRVLEDLMPLADVKGIDIGVEGEQDVQVLADETDLLTLIKNLVDNAIRYTPAGGRIDLAVKVGDGCVRLSVRDNGPGIAAGERERVFDAFYRSLGSHETGSGLGLSIVKAIAERNGARVQIGVADEVTGNGLLVEVDLSQG